MNAQESPADLATACRGLVKGPLYWLLAAIPVALALELAEADALWVFAISALAIVPLAGLMGRATE
ncbi:MAG TPA: hypothetical protein VE890_16770, partial [Thermoguttaceae bacterium]|nr:hypothetical protein [Thermoguttaceae bacterium]